jgi:ubiquinone/menaquinone biosynthesis C-methylase UbiE
MVNKIDTGNKNEAYYSEAIKKAAETNFDEFLRWFNGGTNIVSIRNSGYHDFYNNILKKIIYERTRETSDQSLVLEIGCGGGRILNAACKYFKKSVGTDIHDNFEMLEKFMSIENTNFELLKIQDNKFAIADNSIDFVYTFIVFQHILKLEVFEQYLSEIKRMLKSKSLAIIYFGRPRLIGKKQFSTRLLNFMAYLLDKLFYENMYLNLFKKGYFEDHLAPVNHVNLMVSMKKAGKLCNLNSLKILERGISNKENSIGTQYYIIIEKQ